MRTRLLSILGRRRPRNTGPFVHESWQTNFRSRKNCRFIQEDTGTYSAHREDKKFHLNLKKRQLFAWTPIPFRRYRDLLIEADVTYDKHNGNSALGFFLRYSDDANYYYVLFSTRGNFRFDTVFNGNPRPLIDWTAFGDPQENLRLRLIARGTHFSFFVNDQWVGEIEDDSHASGSIALAAQNYDEKNTADFYLNSFRLNAIPYEVEFLHYRWNRYVPIPRESRLRLAHTLAASEQHGPAIVQLSRARLEHELDAAELFILGECQLHLKLYEEALTSLQKSLSLEPDKKECVAETANLLYLTNRFIELRDFLQEHFVQLNDNPLMWNLLGNAWYALGNFDESADAYLGAIDLDGDTPYYHMNAARAFERKGENTRALHFYTEASLLFFRQELFDELSQVLPSVEKIDAESPVARAIRGKLLFHDGQLNKARAIFAQLIEKNYPDSSIWYLHGVILASLNEQEKAEEYFSKATELEPEFALYWFKLAENRHAVRGDAGHALERALELSPEDPWILNLAGLCQLQSGFPAEALPYLQKALSAAEEEVDILLNYTEALYQSGETKTAMAILQERQTDARCLNQRANFLSRDGEFQKAVDEYERALQLTPADREIAENCAAACIEADRIMRADEILGSLLEDHPTQSLYNLVGHVARLKGEFDRAEAAYKEALKGDDKNTHIRLNLSELYAERHRFQEALAMLETIDEQECNTRAEKLKNKIREAVETKITCATCAREWWVANKIGMQPPLQVLGEPPDESPAGSCPDCGKVFCVGCAKKFLRDDRFICPDCQTNLKLTDNQLRYLVSLFLKAES